MPQAGRFCLLPVPSAVAKAAPNIGQKLGPLGVNMQKFCVAFNARTQNLRPELPMQCTLFTNADGKMKYIVRAPKTSWFLMRAARVSTASPVAWKRPCGFVNLKEVYHICEQKRVDPGFVGVPLREIFLSALGTAKSAGIIVSKEDQMQLWSKRDLTPVWDLARLKKMDKDRNKALGRAAKLAGKK